MRRILALLGTAAVAGAAAVALHDRADRPVLVYAEASAFPQLDVHTISRADTSGRRRHALLAGDSPHLSPDGRLVAFARWTESPRTADVLVVPIGGGPPRVLEHLTESRAWTNNTPAWAPDSRHLVAVEAAGLVVLDAKTGSRRIVVGPVGADVAIESPSFSPDSRRIAYALVDRTGADVWTVSASGGRPRRLTHGGRSAQPLWGPKTIAFARGGSRGDVWAVAADGTGLRRLTHTDAGIYPAYFSSDGTRLLAANPAMHNGRLWAVDTRTGAARDVTGWRGDLFAQGLSRDGKTILAGVGCGGTASPYGVVETLPFAGGKPRVVVRGPCRATWDA
jgi:Tol biopolymer transport system component